MGYGEKLLNFRARHDLTQAQLADLLGVGVNMIHRYENGISAPSMVNRIKFDNKMKEMEVKNNDCD